MKRGKGGGQLHVLETKRDERGVARGVRRSTSMHSVNARSWGGEGERGGEGRGREGGSDESRMRTIGRHQVTHAPRLKSHASFRSPLYSSQPNALVPSVMTGSEPAAKPPKTTMSPFEMDTWECPKRADGPSLAAPTVAATRTQAVAREKTIVIEACCRGFN